MAKNSADNNTVPKDKPVSESGGEKTSEKNRPAAKNAPSLLRQHKKLFIGVGAALAAVILLLIIINPANSPSSVFNRYLGCLRAENDETFTAVSYDANFSSTTDAEAVAELYRQRFSSADLSYKNGGSVNLLQDTDIRIISQEAPKKDSFGSRRTALAEGHRNTGRITDIRDITFEVKRGDQVTTGSAELICVTGKWYIGVVSGI